MKPLPPYVYCCVDHSALTHWIARVIAPRVERLLPERWSANTITAVGSGLMWVLLAGVVAAPAGMRARLGIVWAALLAAYCVLDHVDGCRARIRRTSGAWGEFLDHALDAWHTAILVVVLVVVSGTAVRPGVAALALATAGIATVATWLDQKWRSELRLDHLGPVEAVVISCLYLISWQLPAAADWWHAPLGVPGGWTRADVFFLAGALGSFATALAALVRSSGQAGRLACFAAAAAVLVISGAGGASGWLVWSALSLLIVESTARIIVSHLTNGAAPWPDWAGAVLVAGAAIWPGTGGILPAAALAWLGGRTGLAWWRATVTLRRAPVETA
jgi:phosphatidylglycerophosphate synthase